jgi:hypothetical protein
MPKKWLFLALVWIILAVIVLVFYQYREISPVKDFISWLLSVWPLIAALFIAALSVSTWVIKHDFSSKKRQTIAQVPKKEPLSIEQARETKGNNIHITIEGHIPISSEMKGDMKRVQDAKKKFEKSMEKSVRNYLEKDDKKKV